MTARALVFALSGLALGGCLGAADGDADLDPTTTPIASRPIPAHHAVAAHPLPADVLVPIPPITDPPVPVPPGFASNSVCANAIPVSLGTLADQDISGGASPAAQSCTPTRYPSLFYAVTLPARSVVAVRAESPTHPGALSMYGTTTCQPPADGGCTYVDSTNPGEALYLANAEDTPRRAVFAVQAEDDAAQPRFDLVVTRADVAANATCDTAQPLALDETVSDVATVSGGVADPGSCPLHRSHYYRVAVPPRSRLVPHITADAPIYAYVLGTACDASAACYGDQTYMNVTDAEQEVLVSATQVTWAEGTFSLTFAAEPVAPNALCESPMELPLDTVLTGDGGEGGTIAGCAACFSRLGLNYALEVPAGAKVEVTATALAPSAATWGPVFIAAAPACDSWECVFPPGALGEEATSLVLDNSGGEQARSYVITAGVSLSAADDLPLEQRRFSVEAHVVAE
ncbi:MAG: hypothetical protein CVU56_25825 [Deltaproteobacteria bacterium HGW-Deltaproteobacteria-14]|jgi:hypothetical protein|nr:MAG: hypothetical protein CVU56_25825 [Deltaproteobacteria bacterium HGW-Deltaproteobacteria-14]